jgi:hypothetical protein
MLSKQVPRRSNWHRTLRVGVPQARYSAPALWTGTEIVVWGGEGDSGGVSNTLAPLDMGGRYNPETEAYWNEARE